MSYRHARLSLLRHVKQTTKLGLEPWVVAFIEKTLSHADRLWEYSRGKGFDLDEASEHRRERQAVSYARACNEIAFIEDLLWGFRNYPPRRGIAQPLKFGRRSAR